MKADPQANAQTLPLAGLAARLARRDLLIRAVRGMLLWGLLWAGSCLLVLAARELWPLAGVPPLWVPALVLGALVAGVAVWVTFRGRASSRRLVWLADRQVAGEEQLLTAFEFEGGRPAHPLLPALLRRTEPLARRVDVRRLLRYVPGRAEALVGGFLVLATLAYLLAPLVARQVDPAAARARHLLAAQAQRLEQLGAEWGLLAVQERFDRLARFAEQVQQTAAIFRTDALPPEAGVRLLHDLARSAEALAAEARVSEAEQLAVRGEEQVNPEQSPAPETARDRRDFVARGVGGADGQTLPAAEDLAAERDPEAGRQIEGSTRTPWWQDLDARGQSIERTRTSRNFAESFLLSMAEAEMLTSSRDLSREIETAGGTPTPAAPGESERMADEGAGPEGMPPPGETRPASGGTAAGPTRPGDTGRFGEMDQTATEVVGGARPRLAPVDAGYVDRQVSGSGGAAESETVWMKRPPQPGTRRTPLAPFRETLRPVTLTAEGRGGLPRETWALLRAYHDTLRAEVQRAGAAVPAAR